MLDWSRFRKNIFAGVLAQFAGIVLSLVTAPLIIHGLGVDRYGLWNVAAALGGSIGFVNMILSTTGIRFIAHAIGDRDAQGASEAYQALTAWARLIGGTGALFLIALTPWLAGHAMNVDAAHRELAGQVLLSQAVLIFFQVQSAVPAGAIGAYQRVDIFMAVRTTSQALQTIGSAVWAHTQAGLLGVVWWNCFIQAAEWMTLSWASRRLLPARTPFSLVQMFGWGRRIMRYGGTLLLDNVAAQMMLPLSRVATGLLHSVTAVAYLTVPSTLVGHTRVLAMHVINAAMPAASERSGAGDAEGLRQLYFHSLRLAWMVLVPIGAMVIAFGGTFISLWIGQDFGRMSTPLVAPLMLAIGLYTLGGVGEGMAQATGRLLPCALIAVFSGLANAGLLLWWVRGGGGALEAVHALSAASALFALGIFTWAAHDLHATFRDYVRALDMRLLLLTAGVAWIFSRFSPSATRSDVLVLVGWAGLGFGIIFALCRLWLLEEEWQWIQRRWGQFTGQKAHG